MSACAILQSHPHPVVQSEAITCLQQLHMFSGVSQNNVANNSMDSDNDSMMRLSQLVPWLRRCLQWSPGSHLALRRAAVACLRQLAQREAREVCQCATIVNEKEEESKELAAFDASQFSESGLPGMLFAVLDREMDVNLVSNVHDTLIFIMQSMAADNLTSWLGLLREVLTIGASPSSELEDGTKDKNEVDKDDADEAGDADEFTTGAADDATNKDAIQPRWPTRVFAAKCLRRIIDDCCQGNRAHYDLCLAREMQLARGGRGDYLALHLSELVRVAFMAATSESDPLRLEGLKTMEVIFHFKTLLVLKIC